MAKGNDIKCFTLHGRPDLQTIFDNHPDKGKKSDFEIARGMILDEHKKLHDSVNDIKSTLNKTLPPKEKFKIEPYKQQVVDQTKLDEINKKATQKGATVIQPAENKPPNVVPLVQPSTKQQAKSVVQEQPPPQRKTGRTPATLSGNTEQERQALIKKRKADTYVPSKIIDEQKLLDRVNRFNKTDRRYKRSPAALNELNNIKVSVDSYNRTYNQKYTAVQNRTGDIEYRNTQKDKVQSNNKATGDLSIDEKGVPLIQRSDKTKEVFADLLDLNLFPTGYTVDSRRMADAQLDGAIQDILDGIPSRAANNYLDALEKMIEKDDFDFSKPGIPQQEKITLENIRDTEKQQVGEQMTQEGVMQMLDEQSNLPPDQEQTIVDNIENLINEYEQTDSNTGQVQSATEEGQRESDDTSQPDTQPENAPSEATQTAEDRFNERLDKFGESIIDFLTPKTTIEGTQKQGIGIKEIVHAGIDAIKAAYKISKNIEQAIADGIQVMKDLWNGNNLGDFPEDGLKTVMDKEFADLKQQAATSQRAKTDNEKISDVLNRRIDERQFPTIFANNQDKQQIAADTQGRGQGRQVDGPYVVALQTDLREVSIQSSKVLEDALGADWGLKTLKWIEDNPSQGNIAQVIGILNIISTDNYQDIQDTHNGNQIRKLTAIQKRIDKVSIERARDASLGLNQRRLYEKYAQGGNMADALTQSILSPEMQDLRTSMDEILSEEVSDDEINNAAPLITTKPKKQTIRNIISKAKRQSNPALKDELITKAAAAANKTGKTVKELIDEANAKIKNIKC